MKDQNDTTRRAEDLLRQWGASQAAEQAAAELTAPVAPRPSQKLTAAPPSRARAGVLLRWVPVGLAASLLLAAGVLFMSTAAAPRYSIAPAAPEPAGGPDSPTAVAPASKPADLSEELAAARNDAAEARDALARELARNKASDLQIKELGDKLKRQGDKFAEDQAEWKLLETKLTSLISKAEQSARQARGELLTVREELAAVKAAGVKAPQDPAELKKLKVRLAVAVEELRRQRITFRNANSDRDKAKLALAALKASQQATLDQVRRVYLAAAAPDKTGLAALQEAIKSRGLLRRCVALQRKARTDDEKKLLGRAEIVLTRLGLLEISNSIAVNAYITQLDRSNLVASLDKAMGATATDAAGQDWLFETKLILTGVQRVI